MSGYSERKPETASSNLARGKLLLQLRYLFALKSLRFHHLNSRGVCRKRFDLRSKIRIPLTRRCVWCHQRQAMDVCAPLPLALIRACATWVLMVSQRHRITTTAHRQPSDTPINSRRIQLRASSVSRTHCKDHRTQSRNHYLRC